MASKSASAQWGSIGAWVEPSYQYSASTTASLRSSAASTSPKASWTRFEMLPSRAFSLTRYSGCASDSSIDIAAGSGSYSTLMSLSASSAISSLSAATAAIASPT